MTTAKLQERTDTAPVHDGEVHVPTMLDGVASVFDMFNARPPVYCRGCWQALSASGRQEALTAAWGALGTAMYAAMGRVADEHR